MISQDYLPRIEKLNQQSKILFLNQRLFKFSANDNNTTVNNRMLN